MAVSDGELAQRVAYLMGRAFSEVIVGMVRAGELEKDTGAQILERLEAQLGTLGRQLAEADPAHGLSSHARRCFSFN